MRRAGLASLLLLAAAACTRGGSSTASGPTIPQPTTSGPSAPPRPVIRSVDVVSPTTAWALTDRRVFLTTNSGRRWMDVTPPGRPFIGGFDALRDGAHAWLASPADLRGIRVAVFRTGDGGHTWKRSVVPAMAVGNWIVEHPSFVDPRVGFMTMDPQHGSGVAGSVLFRTTDGGAKWKKVLFDRSLHGPISFIDARTGWALGGPIGSSLLVTHDGGRTWRRVTLKPPRVFRNVDVLVELPAFSGPDQGALEVTYREVLGVAANVSVVFYTSRDQGRAWRASSPLTTHGFEGYGTGVPGGEPTAKDFVVGSPEGLVASHDGGRTWATLSTNVGLGGLSEVDFVTARAGAIVLVQGRESRVFWTTDGGKTFVGADPGVEH